MVLQVAELQKAVFGQPAAKLRNVRGSDIIDYRNFAYAANGLFYEALYGIIAIS